MSRLGRALARAAVLAGCAISVSALASGNAPASKAVPTTMPAAAAALTANNDWASLSAIEQHVLEPLRPQWDKMSDLHRRKWRAIAERYSKLSPEQQERMQARMIEWVKLTPQQRRVARENYQITKSVPPTKKAEAWHTYQQLPEEQKNKLAAAGKANKPATAVSALPSVNGLTRGARKSAEHHKPASAVVASAPVAPAAPAPAVVKTEPAPVPEPAAASAPVAPVGTDSAAPATTSPGG
jgi:hypothetical protein